MQFRLQTILQMTGCKHTVLAQVASACDPSINRIHCFNRGQTIWPLRGVGGGWKIWSVQNIQSPLIYKAEISPTGRKAVHNKELTVHEFLSSVLGPAKGFFQKQPNPHPSPPLKSQMVRPLANKRSQS